VENQPSQVGAPSNASGHEDGVGPQDIEMELEAERGQEGPGLEAGAASGVAAGVPDEIIYMGYVDPGLLEGAEDDAAAVAEIICGRIDEDGQLDSGRADPLVPEPLAVLPSNLEEDLFNQAGEAEEEPDPEGPGTTKLGLTPEQFALLQRAYAEATATSSGGAAASSSSPAGGAAASSSSSSSSGGAAASSATYRTVDGVSWPTSLDGPVLKKGVDIGLLKSYRAGRGLHHMVSVRCSRHDNCTIVAKASDVSQGLQWLALAEEPQEGAPPHVLRKLRDDHREAWKSMNKPQPQPKPKTKAAKPKARGET
jgi:hypothetical protein